MQLSRDAMGTRRFTYTSTVTQQPDGTLALVVTATGLGGEQRMPEPSPDRRSFTGADVEELRKAVAVFLEEWGAAQPASKNQVLCCGRVLTNSITRAEARLLNPNRIPAKGPR